MTAVPIAIADAVVTQINAAAEDDEFSIAGITANRSYFDWDEKYESLGSPLVDVVFLTHQKPDAIRLNARNKLRYEVGVDVCVRQRFEATDRHESTGRLKNTSVDPLVTLLQEIHELFVSNRNTQTLPEEEQANWTAIEVMSWVNQKKLRQGFFEGVVRLRFDFTKAI